MLLLWSKNLSDLVPLKILILFIIIYSTSISNLLSCVPIKVPRASFLPLKRGVLMNEEIKWKGYCGNAKYDWLINKNDRSIYSFNNLIYRDGHYNITNKLRNHNIKYIIDRNKLIDWIVPPNFKKQELKHDKVHRSSEVVERFKNEPVIVRLNVVYDSALAEEYKNDEVGFERFVRNLIFSTQLIFEQPEMSSVIKFNFVVVNLRKSSLNLNNDQSNQILEKFITSSDWLPTDKADLNILLLYRNMWDPTTHGNKQLGLANLGIFCNKPKGALIVHANSLGSSLVLAHELAHNFNCQHDGKGTIEGNCNGNSNIMSPSSGPEKLTWSPCTVKAILYYFSGPEIFNCIYDRRRIANSKPYKPIFDFTNNPDNPNRKILPGEDKSIDMQCSEALDRTAISLLTTKDFNYNRYTTCQDLVCLLGGVISISIGPAPSGSVCDKRGSKCFNGLCGLKPN